MNQITLRPTTPEDEPFLFALYASTRSAEMEAWGWPVEQQQSFLQLQYRAQQQSYGLSYDGAETNLILSEGEPAGRIIVRRSDTEILGVDIALLPDYRNAGIGSQLIGQLQHEAAATGKTFVFQVQRNNLPAIRLYERLGFAVVGANELTFTMVWQPRVDK
jgi:ribosomal protein S18 acetylase RimI-like enzyme